MWSRSKGEKRSTHAEDPDENEESKLEEVPISIKVDLEQYELPSSERIHCAEYHCSDESAEE